MHLTYSFALLAQTEKVAPPQNQILPLDYPKYVDTGNLQQDNQKYTAAKQAWIVANPVAYEKINNQSESAPQNNIAPATQTQNQDKVDSAPHYPIVPITGNVAVDEKAHIEAKNNWIKTHPEEYRQAGGKPEELNNNKTTNETVTPSKPVFVLPTFNAQKAYQLIKTEAVLVAGQKKTAAEIAEETEKLKEDFPENRTQLQIGANNQIRIYALGVIDVRATEKRNDNKVEWFFENKECATCSKTLYLDIEEETATLLTYVMQSEDENAPFAYRLAFQLTAKP